MFPQIPLHAFMLTASLCSSSDMITNYCTLAYSSSTSLVLNVVNCCDCVTFSLVVLGLGRRCARLLDC